MGRRRRRRRGRMRRRRRRTRSRWGGERGKGGFEEEDEVKKRSR